jgi:hypothetical protein
MIYVRAEVGEIKALLKAAKGPANGQPKPPLLLEAQGPLLGA